jgi:hypothetical protein
MKLIEWSGRSEEIICGVNASAGTGQSGSNAVSTTADQVMTNAKSWQITQQTSSGDGDVHTYFALPCEQWMNKMKANLVIQVDSLDVDIDAIYLHLFKYDGTNKTQASLKWNSGYGLVEEFQYLNSANTYVDTGLTYYSDISNTAPIWMNFGFTVDFATPAMTQIHIGNQFADVSYASRQAAVGGNPFMQFKFGLSGDDTLSRINIDRFSLEVLD